MTNYIFAVLLAIITLLSVVLNKIYHQLPIKELRYKARQNKQPEKTLYRVSAYGSSLQTLLAVVIVLAVAGSFVLLAGQLSRWFSYLAIVFLLWLAFLWLPSSRLSSFGRHLAVWFAPLLAWVLDNTHPIFEKLSHIINDYSAPYGHTGIYDKADLVELMEWQKSQPDSRISSIELNMAQSVMNFGDRLVSDVLIPRQKVHVVNIKDNISPVLIDELHKSGLSFFPVYESKKDNIVGTLFIGDLIDLDQAKNNQLVKNIMKPAVYYVHEDFNLLKVFRAFLKTHHHLFIVVNKFEEFVGVVSIENIVSEILGEPITDEFDNYEDLRAVASVKVKDEPGEEDSSSSTVDTEEMIE
jgi:CBS domain containing-hemolysin-like protein